MPLLIALLLMLLSRTADAGQREFDRERARLAERGAPGLSVAEEQQLATRGWRDRRVGEFRPLVANTARPADYVSDVKRGTVEYSEQWKNYSYHTVQMPNGTVVDCTERGRNFSQIAPNTDAFERSPGFGRNLTFRNCNLTNVKVHPDWTLDSCNNAQVDQVGDFDAEGSVRITDTVYVAQRSDLVPAQRVKPVGALEP